MELTKAMKLWPASCCQWVENIISFRSILQSVIVLTDAQFYDKPSSMVYSDEKSWVTDKFISQENSL